MENNISKKLRHPQQTKGDFQIHPLVLQILSLCYWNPCEKIKNQSVTTITKKHFAKLLNLLKLLSQEEQD